MPRPGTSAIALWAAACSAPTPPTPIQPTLELAAPWFEVERSEATLAVRYLDTPHGVRIWFDPPGLSPVHAGRTYGQPLIAAPFAPLQRASVSVSGPDLVVRLYGPPLSDVLDHPDAPDDPVHTWIRIRQRGDDWLLAVDGLAELTVDTGRLEVTTDDRDLVAQTDFGAFRWRTDAPAIASAWTGRRWWVSTVPSAAALQPYPRTAFRWRPPGDPTVVSPSPIPR